MSLLIWYCIILKSNSWCWPWQKNCFKRNIRACRRTCDRIQRSRLEGSTGKSCADLQIFESALGIKRCSSMRFTHLKKSKSTRQGTFRNIWLLQMGFVSGKKRSWTMLSQVRAPRCWILQRSTIGLHCLFPLPKVITGTSLKRRWEKKKNEGESTSNTLVEETFLQVKHSS